VLNTVDMKCREVCYFMPTPHAPHANMAPKITTFLAEVQSNKLPLH